MRPLVWLCLLGATLAAQVRTEFGVWIPMRDGVRLSADIWMPLAPGRYPVILLRTPYLKTDVLDYPTLGNYFASRGYVVVVQDVRGRGDSDGQFDFLFPEGQDGYDSVEWAARQPWSNSKVGLMGISYLGTVQWQAAMEQPPHLVCMVPTAAMSRMPFDNLPYRGGAFRIKFMLEWLNKTSGRLMQNNGMRGVDWTRILQHRPLLTMDEALGRHIRLYREFLQHDTLDAYWKRIEFQPADFTKVTIPVLHVTGWFDHQLGGTLYYWEHMNPPSAPRDNHFIVIGPWIHIQTFNGGARKLGELEFGADSAVDMKAMHLAFFDRYLKGSAPRFDFPRVKAYITGSNQWREFAVYPPPEAQVRKLYLHSGGKANMASGDGRLTWEAPGDEPPDHYTYDPKQPAPSSLLALEEFQAAEDHRSIEERTDVLVYSTEPFKEPLTLLGRAMVNLFAASDARDTDFTAKLLDVFPDGRAVNLGSWAAGIIRARYRQGYQRVQLLTPGRVEEFRIDVGDFGHTFLAGHRLRLEISSSNFPYMAPNQNTGNPVATDTEWKTAAQTVHHDRARPSWLQVSVMPK